MSRNYVNLLPRPPGEFELSVHEPGKRRNKSVKAACQRCKARKSKCSGEPAPCSLCVSTNSECLFLDPVPVQRRLAMKNLKIDLTNARSDFIELRHKYERLLRRESSVDGAIGGGSSSRATDDSKYEKLLHILRSSDPATIQSLIADIKANESFDIENEHHLEPESGDTRGPPSFTSDEISTASHVASPEVQSSAEASASALTRSNIQTVLNDDDMTLWHPLLRPRQEKPLSPSMLAVNRHNMYRNLKPTSADKRPMISPPTVNQVQTDPQQESSGSATDRNNLQNLGNLATSSAMLANYYPEDVQQYHLNMMYLCEWEVLPINTKDDSYIGTSYLGFRDASVRALKEGVPLSTIVADSVNVDRLVIGHDREDTCTIAKWACELQALAQNANVNSRQIGISLFGVCQMFYYVRWAVNPTAETYTDIPWLIRPTILQRVRPHLAAFDLTGLGPGIRDYLVMQPPDILAAIASSGLHVHWDPAKVSPYNYSEERGWTLSDEFVRFTRSPLASYFDLETFTKGWPEGMHLVQEFRGRLYPKEAFIAARQHDPYRSPAEQLRHIIEAYTFEDF